MTKLFFKAKRAKNDINGNGRWSVELFGLSINGETIVDCSDLLAGKLRNTKQGYILKSVNVRADLQSMFKGFDVIQIF